MTEHPDASCRRPAPALDRRRGDATDGLAAALARGGRGLRRSSTPSATSTARADYKRHLAGVLLGRATRAHSRRRLARCVTPSSVALTVNEHAARACGIEPRETLADVLRDRLGLTGTKVSCDAQVCGACTVLVDGLAVSACTYLAVRRRRPRGRARSRGSPRDGRADAAPAGVHRPRRVPVRLLHAGHADGRDGPARGRTRRRRARRSSTGIEGNMCRCTGYAPIVDAVLRRPPRTAGDDRCSGVTTRADAARRRSAMSVPRRDGVAKVTGRRALHGRPGDARDWPTRSSCGAPTRTPGSARSTSRPLARMPGVIAVVTAADLPDVDLVLRPRRGGPPAHRRPARSGTRARPSSASSPRTPSTADEAARAGQRRVRAAAVRDDRSRPLAAGAPIHPREARRAATHTAASRRTSRRDHPNVCSLVAPGVGRHRRRVRATPTSSSRASTATRCATPTRWSRTRAIAAWADGELTVWTLRPAPVHGPRGPGALLRAAAVGGAGDRALRRRRVTARKSYTKIEPLTAALALRAGRPVKLALSIDESILTTRGDGALVRIARAFDRDGELLGRQAEILLEHRGLRRELAAGRAQGGEPPRRARTASRRST